MTRPLRIETHPPRNTPRGSGEPTWSSVARTTPSSVAAFHEDEASLRTTSVAPLEASIRPPLIVPPAPSCHSPVPLGSDSVPPVLSRTPVMVSEPPFLVNAPRSASA